MMRVLKRPPTRNERQRLATRSATLAVVALIIVGYLFLELDNLVGQFDGSMRQLFSATLPYAARARKLADREVRSKIANTNTWLQSKRGTATVGINQAAPSEAGSMPTPITPW